MNRLVTVRSFSQKNLSEKQNSFAPSLGPFLKRNLKTATPVSASFGRGYGLVPHSGLNLSFLLPGRELVSLSLRGMSVGKVAKNKPDRDIEEESLKPKNYRSRESLEDITKDLVQLTEKEIQTLMDNDASSVQTERGKTWLEQSQYALRPVENDPDKLMLTKKIGNTVVTVTFKKTYEEVEEEEEEGGAEEPSALDMEDQSTETKESTILKDEENEGQESWIRSGDELPDRENFPDKHSMEIDIRISDRDGNPKGILHMYGFAGLDDRLYINEMICDSDIKTENLEKKSLLTFDDLSDPMQDRIYDYLDELGLDDRMAHFVKTTVAREKIESDIAFLTNLRDILKA